MKFNQFFQWIVAYYVAIKDKEQTFSVILLDDFLGKFQWSSCSQSLSFLRISNLDVIFCLKLTQLILNMMSLIVYGNNDFLNANFGQCLNDKCRT